MRKQTPSLTSTEAFEQYEAIFSVLKWERKSMGIFCQANLLVGRYDSNLKEWVVQRDSLESLIKYVDKNFKAAMEQMGG
jgi:hypothetical protein